jgi:hypothetical protein
MSRLTIVCVSFGACTSGEPSTHDREPTPARVIEPSTPRDVYVAAELGAHISDVFEYPPTACRLRSLLGPEFERLTRHGGYYPGAIEERGEGFAYFAMRCPQPYCDTALVWVHPDGGMVAAMRSDASAQLWTNRPELRRNLPSQVATYLSSAEPRALAGEPSWAGALEQPLPDPPECRTAELEARRLRFLAAAGKRACDPEYSHVWKPAAVKPSTGDTSWFHDSSETAVGERREDHVRAGDLVALGWAHADDPRFTCAASISIDGDRTTGWLLTADLVELAHVGDPPARAALDALATGDTPAWLSVGGKARRFGALELQRVGEDVVVVDLEREIAGHSCGVEGRLRLVGPRVLADIDTGCETVAVLFDNAVAVWERGCGGARASCTDGYFAAAR